MNNKIATAYRYHRANGGTASGSLYCARLGVLLDEATDAGVVEVKWEYEQESYEDVFGFESDDERKQWYRDIENGTITGPYWVAMSVEGETLASLGMVTLGPRDIDGDYYARLVTIELAAEIEDEIRQALGDVRDARITCPV